MENKFRKPTRLRGTPAHQYVNGLALGALSFFIGIGGLIAYFTSDRLENPNNRLSKIERFFEDTEQDRVRHSLRTKFIMPPVKEEETVKTHQIVDRSVQY